MDSIIKEAIAEYNGLSTIEELDKNIEKYKYHLNFLKRAEVTLERIKTNSRIGNLENKCILDIGFGFGGILNILASQGAFAYGFEINKRAYRVCEKVNKKYIDEGRVKILLGDVSYPYIFHQFDNKFDLVILDDVFEHIHNTTSLVQNISLSSKDGTYLYFNIPNYMYCGYVISEPHKRKYGLSLLTPDSWTKLGIDAGFSIYHREFIFYDSILKYNNFYPYAHIKIEKLNMKK